MFNRKEKINTIRLQERDYMLDKFKRIREGYINDYGLYWKSVYKALLDYGDYDIDRFFMDKDTFEDFHHLVAFEYDLTDDEEVLINAGKVLAVSHIINLLENGGIYELLDFGE